MALCDCEVYEICPSCSPDEPTYAKAASVPFAVVQPAPCQHNHGVVVDGAMKCFDCGEVIAPSVEMPRRYTVEQLKDLAYDYCGDATSAARLDDRLRLSLFITWLKRKESERGTNGDNG